MEGFSQQISRLGYVKIEYLIRDDLLPTREEAETVLINFEREIGMSLPQECRDFLLEYGGGYLGGGDHDVIFKCIHTPSSDLADHGRCEIFFYIPKHDGGGHAYNLFWNYRCFLDRMPRNLIPIAADGGGNIICISALGKDCGKVYYWDHELEEEPMEEEECTYSNISLIGDNFLHFLDSLELDRIPD